MTPVTSSYAPLLGFGAVAPASQVRLQGHYSSAPRVRAVDVNKLRVLDVSLKFLLYKASSCNVATCTGGKELETWMQST